MASEKFSSNKKYILVKLDDSRIEFTFIADRIPSVLVGNIKIPISEFLKQPYKKIIPLD